MSDLSNFRSDRTKEWSATVWDGLIEAISARFAPLEEQLDVQRATTEAIVRRGLTVIEQELAPVVAQGAEVLGEINDVKAAADAALVGLTALINVGVPVANVIGLTAALAGKASASHEHQIIEVLGLDAALASKATPADITASIVALKSELLGGAGAAFDTLAELAALLGNDPNFATTLATSLSERVAYTAQSKSGPEKAQARTNIEALTYGAAQALTLLQRHQVHQNIGSEYVFIEEQNVTNAGDVRFYDLGAYRELMFKCEVVPEGGAGQLFWRGSSDDGADFRGGSGDYYSQYFIQTGTGSAVYPLTSQTLALLSAYNIKGVPAGGQAKYQSFATKIVDWGVPVEKTYQSRGHFLADNSTWCQDFISGTVPISLGLNALLIGTISRPLSGRIRLYGSVR